MAVAQPIGSKSVQVIRFDHPAVGRIGPIALQIHNAGLFDECKDGSIEIHPQEEVHLTTR